MVLIAAKLTLVVQTKRSALACFELCAQLGNGGVLGNWRTADTEVAAGQGGKGQFTFGCGVAQGMTPA
uniref:Uncharacterized protein n=1 Tax=Panagrolaimus superbus TaxID=310955 RepID=A0A914YML4_9BILA